MRFKFFTPYIALAMESACFEMCSGIILLPSEVEGNKDWAQSVASRSPVGFTLEENLCS